MMRALGFEQIKEFAEAEAALREIEHFGPDIVLTDWHMEPMDGIELVKRIRNEGAEEVRYVPIVMLTGHSEADRVCAARNAGANEFLAKPVSANSIHSPILRIIENPRPFIKSEDYFGPDRRRHNEGPPDGIAERREARANPAVDNFSVLSENEAAEFLAN
ncbi:MAG: response regulator [Rickettsiales bacterium]